MAKHQNFITPVGRASYVHVWEMSELPNGKMAYNMAIIFPKDDEAGIKTVKAAIQSAAIDFFGEDKSKWPTGMRNPLNDGDEDDNKRGAAYANSFYLNLKSDKKPGVVGPDAKPLLDQDEFYSGCYCRASINFFGYNKAGNKGVGVGLNNVMKVKDGERLDGRQNAETEFAEFAAESQDEGEFFDD